MRFFASQQELAFVLTKLQSVIGAKPAKPILSNILIEALHQEVTLSASDLTVGVKMSLEAKVTENGATTLPAKKLTSLIKELQQQTVEFATNQENFTEIVSGTSSFKLCGMNPQEFPTLPQITNADTIQVESLALKEALWRASFAVSREDSRYVLTGILMQFQEDKIVFVGTDGKKLAKSSCAFEGQTEITQAIIPIKAVDELTRLLEEDEQVTLHLEKDRIGFETPQSILVTKLLSGDFPDFMRVIPPKTQYLLPMHREELIALLRQVSLFTHESHQSVRFTFEDQELKLSANTMDVGEGKVSMPVNYSGEKLDVAFNPNYFIEILRRCNKETIALGVSDAFNPGVLLDTKNHSTTYTPEDDLFVLMPMRLEE